MPLGTCKMCLQEKELLRSHLIPRAVHEYTTAGGHKPITLRKGVLMSGNVQLQDYLLCLGCEQILNDGGEDWTVDKLATHEGQFPLYDLVTAKEADRSFNTTRVYFMVDRPEVPFEKLVHFGMGMFFKAAVHPWEGGKIDPRIELGPYAESLRRWLRGDAGFPNMCAW
jgi:hypothetical protein